MKMKQAELQKHLDAVAKGVRSGDTLEGGIQFFLLDHEYWEVEAAYRTGNIEGQGGMVVIKQSANMARS